MGTDGGHGDGVHVIEFVYITPLRIIPGNLFSSLVYEISGI